jgi:uncharacterized membrane protein
MPGHSPEPNVQTESIDQVSQNISTIMEIYQKGEENIALHQRLLERFAEALAKPISLCFLLTFVILWIGGNEYGRNIRLHAWDQTPYPMLQGLLTLSSLILAGVILVTQNRQGKADQRRSHLELQINLLTEQRSAKIISLLEELRRDMPTVADRVDPEAEALSSPGSPHAIMDALDGQLGVSDETERD